MIGIQANGNEKIGLGHLKRTGAIADELIKKGNDVIYLSHSPEFIDEYDSVKLIHQNIEETKTMIDKNDIELLVVDSYEVDLFYLNEVNKVIPVMFIDDLCEFDEYNMTYLVNGNIYGNKLNYNGNAKKLLGPKYCLLRKEFKEIKNKCNKKVSSILVTFGGSDVKYATIKILPWIEKFINEIDIKIIIGPGFKDDHISKIEKYNQFNLIYSPKSMKDIIIKSDIAITASGSTVYELLTCGVPFINICTEANQKFIAKEIRERNLGLFPKNLNELNKQVLIDNLEKLISDNNFRNFLSKQGQKLFDGKGAKRVADEIDNYRNNL